jgi:hypothetical protein
MGSVQSAQSRLAAVCTCVEEYASKLAFLEELAGNERALDHACSEVTELRD